MTAHDHPLIPGLISVIIPVYNAASTLPAVIDSILAQTHDALELILSNDGSTDDSLAICQAQAARDARIRVLDAPNGGPSAARNRALPLIRGEFVFFLDADDTLVPTALATLLARQRQSDADIVVGDFLKFVAGQPIESGHRRYFSGDATLDQAGLQVYIFDHYLPTPNRYHLFVYVWGRLIRSGMILSHDLRFDESLHTYEDVTFNFDLMLHVRKLVFADAVVLHKSVNKHDGFAIGHQLAAARGWRQFGYLEALKHIAVYIESQLSGKQKDHMLNRLDNTCVVYTVITLIRLCGLVSWHNWRDMLRLIRRVLPETGLQNGLQTYQPRAGESRLVPWLLRHRLALPLMLTCAVKSRLRYR